MSAMKATNVIARRLVRMRVRGALIGAGVALAAGCGVMPERPAPAAIYDLGPGEAGALAPALAPARIILSAPPWLQSGTMHYRTEWNGPERRRAYAGSRWAAEPAAMLGLVLGRALGGGGGRCRLRIEVDEFEQVFMSPRDSEARLVLRAALLAPGAAGPLASTTLNLSEPAPTPDAGGAAVAFRNATARLAATLAAWMSALDRELPGGLGTGGPCGR